MESLLESLSKIKMMIIYITLLKMPYLLYFLLIIMSRKRSSNDFNLDTRPYKRHEYDPMRCEEQITPPLQPLTPMRYLSDYNSVAKNLLALGPPRILGFMRNGCN